jgi:hypothetical protein
MEIIMKHSMKILLMAACVTALLMTSCARVDFNNPLDSKGNNYLYGDPSCEEEKIRDSEEGAGLFTNPELMMGCF